MAKLNLYAIIGAALVGSVSGNAFNSDGPISAAIDQVITIVQVLGYTGEGARPIGWGFEIEYVGPNDPVEVPDAVFNPNAEGELTGTPNQAGDDEPDKVEIPGSVFNPDASGELNSNPDNSQNNAENAEGDEDKVEIPDSVFVPNQEGGGGGDWNNNLNNPAQDTVDIPEGSVYNPLPNGGN